MEKAKISADAGKSGANSAKAVNERLRIVLLVVVVAFVLIAISILFNGTPHSCAGIVYSQQRYDCFSQQAEATGNASLCTHIGNSQIETECLVNVSTATGNVSFCSLISNPASEYGCVSGLSASAKNESYCSVLSNSSLASECEYDFAAAMNFSNASYCNGITNSSEMQKCRQLDGYHLAMETGNASYCDVLNASVGGGVPPQDLFYSVTNASTTEYGYDLGFINMSDRNICYYATAVKYKNSTLCGALPIDLSDSCDIAINSTVYNTTKARNASQIESECESEEDLGPTIYNTCFFGLAITFKNSSYCSYISNTTERDSCVSSVTNSTSNSTT